MLRGGGFFVRVDLATVAGSLSSAISTGTTSATGTGGRAGLAGHVRGFSSTTTLDLETDWRVKFILNLLLLSQSGWISYKAGFASCGAWYLLNERYDFGMSIGDVTQYGWISFFRTEMHGIKKEDPRIGSISSFYSSIILYFSIRFASSWVHCYLEWYVPLFFCFPFLRRRGKGH